MTSRRSRDRESTRFTTKARWPNTSSSQTERDPSTPVKRVPRVLGWAPANWMLTIRHCRNRLKEHTRSIEQVDNLTINDFSYRVLAIVPVWIVFAEQALIKRYVPVWNSCLDGFGKHQQGGRRSAYGAKLAGHPSPWKVMDGQGNTDPDGFRGQQTGEGFSRRPRMKKCQTDHISHSVRRAVWGQFAFTKSSKFR